MKVSDSDKILGTKLTAVKSTVSFGTNFTVVIS